MTAIASAVMLISFGWSGRASHAWLVVAFSLYAIFSVAETAATLGYVPSRASSHALGVAVCSIGFFVALRAVSGPTIETRVTPARAALAAFLGVAFLTLVLKGAAFLFDFDAVSGMRTADARAVVAIGMAAVLSTTVLTVLLAGLRRRPIAYEHLFVLCCSTMAAWLAVVTEQGRRALPLTATLIITLGATVTATDGLQRLSRRLAEQSRTILDLHVRTATVTEAARMERSRRDERDHDLRSGLLAVETTIEDINARVPAESGLQHLATAASSETSRLRRLLSAGERPAAGDVIDLRSVLAPVLLLERARGVDLHTNFADDLRVGVPPDLIVRVTRILLDNARLHAPKSRVDLTSRRCGNRTEITVRDHGADIAQIASDTQTHRERGGLGLLSATRLLEVYGGFLRVDRGESGGLMVTIDLPSSQEPQGEVLRATTFVAGRRRADHPASERALRLYRRLARIRGA
ncbi:MAG TPA: HAMP domain-containing sensor histidine kinase [Acidimicrobiales bacterium]|nr:HAMP domain-containing sensor histidine kinase [Acidimicrobiales bacterium]